MNMKIGVVALVVALVAEPAPAIDLVLDEAAVMKAGEQLSEMGKQLTEAKAQVEQLRNTYDSVTRSRNLGSILDNPALRNYLPEQWQGVYDAVRRGGYEGLSGRAAGIYQNTKVFDGCGHLTIIDERQACEAAAVKPAQDKALALDAYDQATNRINQLTQLMQRVGQTTDLKELGEIQGRLAVEQAMIQNEQTKMQLYALVSEAEERMQEQQRRELNAKQAARRGWVQPQSIQFGGG